MRWAIAFHPDQIARGPNGRRRLMVPPIIIAEGCLATARGQGWVVLASDSDVETPADTNINVQSNPRRHNEGEDDGA